MEKCKIYIFSVFIILCMELKNRPYTLIIIIKLSTVINKLPISVTAHNGIDSKKPQSSIASTSLSGNIVFEDEPKPAEFIIFILNNAIINSKPYVITPFASAK